ncbi:MAG TPA: hemerythrin [Lachnospiraceae bacterium]|nr:hemerythrin [Lachnospiraceae bacterium]
MGNRLVWDKRYNVGVAIIDREHKKLFSILNKLYAFGHSEEKSHFACQEAIKYFKDHAVQHFADEEAYMASINYPGLEAHRRIHRDFRERMLPALEHELELSHFSATSIHHFLGVCAGWLMGHTLIEDHMIVSGEPVRHWEKLLPEEEQAVMGQTIASLLHSMFRLDTQLISSCYSGENFGDTICCRLVYSGKDKKKWEFFLLFEEQLIGSTIGNVIDTKSESTDMMLSNVAKYAARQLVERIRQNFSSLQPFDLTNEHLLSYEQFYKMYERQSPQFSFLFDTGRGYFAYCMAASEIPLRRDGISAVTINAVSELENRLSSLSPSAESEVPPHSGSASETASTRKKKILVVDDSDFMRTSMLHLLNGDYEVQTADSGMSAIRSITLARPDLILLDYEMPVCSGSQVLEMIRSEKDFAGIPVIFLTCRVDRESVRKAISLRPEGYLSKSLSADSIKREIDHFFEKKGRMTRETSDSIFSA